MIQTNFYDAIVIGARCAGSPTAMLLARQGYRVLLLEKAPFPSEVPRGHMIQATGVALLKEWGLFEQVLASNCPPISRSVFDLGEFALVGMPEGTTLTAPRHGILDKILADAATASGVERREGFLVQEILTGRGSRDWHSWTWPRWGAGHRAGKNRDWSRWPLFAGRAGSASTYLLCQTAPDLLLLYLLL